MFSSCFKRNILILVSISLSLCLSHEQLIRKKQIRTIQINDKNKTEIIAYNNDNFTIENLTKYIKEIIQEKMYNIDNFNNLFIAPLVLKDPVFWNNSNLKKILG